MDKKPSPARFKKKKAELRSEDEASNGSPEAQAAQAVPQGASPVAIEPRTYERKRWKHAVRWLAFLFILMLDVSLVGSAVRAQFVHHNPLTMQMLARVGILYLIILLCNCMVLPSIAMEADKIEVSNEGLVIRNLLLKCTIAWNEITHVSAPVYLKFAIIRTRNFFQLINKRDIPQFNELMQTIQTRTGLPSK